MEFWGVGLWSGKLEWHWQGGHWQSCSYHAPNRCNGEKFSIANVVIILCFEAGIDFDSSNSAHLWHTVANYGNLKMFSDLFSLAFLLYFPGLVVSPFIFLIVVVVVYLHVYSLARLRGFWLEHATLSMTRGQTWRVHCGSRFHVSRNHNTIKKIDHARDRCESQISKKRL